MTVYFLLFTGIGQTEVTVRKASEAVEGEGVVAVAEDEVVLTDLENVNLTGTVVAKKRRSTF